MSLEKIFKDIAFCKGKKTCPRLKVREGFFEPNPGSLRFWATKREKYYLDGIDTRVIFVCDCPSNRRDRDSKGDFFAPGNIKGWIWWTAGTSQSKKFLIARREKGFQHCLIVNTIQCGPLDLPANITEKELSNCIGNVLRIIEFVRPPVLVAMGEMAAKRLLDEVVPRLHYSPVVLRMTHYSYRGRRGKTESLHERWEREYCRLRQALTNRGYSSTKPHLKKLWSPWNGNK